MFFATLFSTVALGAIIEKKTGNQIGLSEYLDILQYSRFELNTHQNQETCKTVYFPDVFARDSLKSTRILASRADKIESYSKAVYYYEQLFTLEHRRKEILKYSKTQRSANY